MDEINNIYNEFLNNNYISDFSDLKNVLTIYPFFCDVRQIERSSFYQINYTKKTYLDINHEVTKLFNCFVVNKDNINNFFYFGKSIKNISIEELEKDINEYKIFLMFDSIKYKLFYSDKWYIISPYYSSIKNLIEKKEFEINTLYDLFEKYKKFFKINLRNLNKNYNYTFELSNIETNLIINNYDCFFKINSIIDKKTNKEIELNLYEIQKFDNIGYNKMIDIKDKKELKTLLKKDKYHYLLLKDDNNNLYSIDFNSYKIRKKDLDNFIENPIITIIDLKLCNRLEIFCYNYLQLSIYIKKIDFILDNLVRYYLDLYKKEKILKRDNLEYKQYDKEVLYKIHGIFLRYKIVITKNDVLRTLKELNISKLKTLLYRL